MTGCGATIETAHILLKLAKAGLIVRVNGLWVLTDAGRAMLEKQKASTH